MAIVCHIEDTLKDSCDRLNNLPRTIRTYRKRRKRIYPVVIEPIPNAVVTNENTPVVYLHAVRDAVVVDNDEEEVDPLTPPTQLI